MHAGQAAATLHVASLPLGHAAPAAGVVVRRVCPVHAQARRPDAAGSAGGPVGAAAAGDGGGLRSMVGEARVPPGPAWPAVMQRSANGCAVSVQRAMHRKRSRVLGSTNTNKVLSSRGPPAAPTAAWPGARRGGGIPTPGTACARVGPGLPACAVSCACKACAMRPRVCCSTPLHRAAPSHPPLTAVGPCAVPCSSLRHLRIHPWRRHAPP